MPSLSLLEMFVIIWVGACVHRLVYYKLLHLADHPLRLLIFEPFEKKV